MDSSKGLKTLIVEVPIGMFCEDEEIVTAEALKREFPAAGAIKVEIPLWNLEGDGACTGFVQHHFAKGQGMMIMLNYHLRPDDKDLNKISPRYQQIKGLSVKGRRHVFVSADVGLTWGDLRKALQKHQTILYHRIIHYDG